MEHPVTMDRLVDFIDKKDEQHVTLIQLRTVQAFLNESPVEEDDVLLLKVITLQRPGVPRQERKALQMVVFDPEINVQRMRSVIEQNGCIVP